MAKRKGLTQKIRFEVFKRDSFTCQYCGGKSPSIVLVVDHIHPVAEGGDNDIMNLVTSCEPCNAGKGARKLDDQTTVEKQRTQVEELQLRREQLEMMMAWQHGLKDLDLQAANSLKDLWSELVPGWTLNDQGIRDLVKLVRKHGVADVAQAMRESVGDYLQFAAGEQNPTKESVGKAWDYVARIANFKRVLEEKPYMKDVMYVRAICKNRFNYCVEWEAKALLERAFVAGMTREQMKSLACSKSSWASWRNEMEDILANAEMSN